MAKKSFPKLIHKGKIKQLVPAVKSLRTITDPDHPNYGGVEEVEDEPETTINVTLPKGTRFGDHPIHAVVEPRSQAEHDALVRKGYEPVSKTEAAKAEKDAAPLVTPEEEAERQRALQNQADLEPSKVEPDEKTLKGGKH